MNKYGGKLGLLNVSKEIIAMLKLATIDTLFKIYNSSDEIEYR
jgi:anti-anti-sigma regulatory factor